MTNEASIGPDYRPESDSERPEACRDGKEAARQKKLLEIPVRQRQIFRQAWKGRSRKAAIRAFCLECIGYEAAEVNRCTAPTCPLYEFREGRM